LSVSLWLVGFHKFYLIKLFKKKSSQPPEISKQLPVRLKGFVSIILLFLPSLVKWVFPLPDNFTYGYWMEFFSIFIVNYLNQRVIVLKTYSYTIIPKRSLTLNFLLNEMKKRNIIAIILFGILFTGSIYVYSLNNNKIKDNKNKTESLKIELETLKAENKSLTKTNSELIETNSNISEKVNSLKNVPN